MASSVACSGFISLLADWVVAHISTSALSTEYWPIVQTPKCLSAGMIFCSSQGVVWLGSRRSRQHVPVPYRQVLQQLPFLCLNREMCLSSFFVTYLLSVQLKAVFSINDFIKNRASFPSGLNHFCLCDIRRNSQ